MPEHIHYEDEDLFNPETHHEHSDVPVRPLFVFLIIFVVFAVVCHFVVLLLFKGMSKAEKNREAPPLTAMSRPASSDVPQNQPLLQPFPRQNEAGIRVAPQSDTPVTDLVTMRARENERLQKYGWVDKTHGVVHMPIGEAKELLAARMAVQGQVTATPAPASSEASPVTTAPASGQTVPPSTAVAPPAAPAPSTTTSGGAHP
jgi:hypothetical protein